MTPDQLGQHIIEPVLLSMNMYSKEAYNLLLGTALHESDGLKRITQYNGPALGYWQMEPNTLDDLYNSYLGFRPGKRALLENKTIPSMTTEDNLKMNPVYACAAARLHYLRQPSHIPIDIWGQAKYWKKYWNTFEGKGTVEQYLERVRENKDYFKY